MSDILRLSVFNAAGKIFRLCAEQGNCTDERKSVRFHKMGCQKTPTWDVGQYSEE